MEDSEKMVALKKAYAEIILNTAKEAAARVMASERRALRSQHDLNAAKDESLRLLLRLKKMVDAKEVEAEINAINQRKRIEELEAQLQETEDKILDLRTEIRNVSYETEKRKHEMQLFRGVNAEEKVVDLKDETPEDNSNILEPIVPYSSDSELETEVTSAVKDGAFRQRIQDHGSPNAAKQIGEADVSTLQNYFGRSPHIASIIMRKAEPELFRNGCTQRIRAFESQQPDVTLATEEVDDGCIPVAGVKPEVSEKNGRMFATRKKLLKEEIKKSKLLTGQRRKCRSVGSKSSSRRSCFHQLVRCSQSSVTDGNLANGNPRAGEAVLAEISSVHAKLEDPAGLQEKPHNNRNPSSESKALKGKRKRKMGRRKTLANVKRYEVCTGVIKEEAEGSLQCLDPLLLLCQTTEDSAAGLMDLSTTVKEQKLLNESQEIDTAEVCEIANFVPDPEEIDGPVRNADIAHDSKGPTDAKDRQILKYTFQRKRKRDFSNCPDEGVSPEKGNTEKLAADPEDAAEESRRSSFANESSRDSRRLAQVARQLISLSGKRW